jgi:hypothetical protein
VSEIVFILGAGASKQAGAPVMKEFLDAAERLARDEDLGGARADFELVSKGLDALQQAQSKAYLDLVNIESVFAAFEATAFAGRLGSLPGEEIKRLPTAMRRVIATTLERLIVFTNSEGRIRPPAPYGAFADLVGELVWPNWEPRPLRASVITFNYDVCLDLALQVGGVPVNYGLGEPTATPADVSLLKLHGSLNWARCPECQALGAWDLGDFLARSDFRGEAVRLEVASRIHEFSPCGKCGKPPDGPMIVPPTWNKGQYHGELREVWRGAARELSNAESIIVVGYPFPPTDQFFHYLYAVGTIGDARLRRFWVFDPDDEVKGRFEGLLGQQGVDRFRFHRATFEGSIGTCRELIGEGRVT